jgi:hypothetical protein
LGLSSFLFIPELSVVDRHVIARESNGVRVDFSRDPDPPAARFLAPMASA